MVVRARQMGTQDEGPAGPKKRQDEYLNKVKRLEAEDRKRKAVAQSAWGLGSFMGMSGLGSAQQQGRSYDEGEVVEGRPRDTPQLTSSQRSVRREREANVPWEADFGATNDNQEGVSAWWKMMGKKKKSENSGDRSVYEYNYDDMEDEWEEQPVAQRRRPRRSSNPVYGPAVNWWNRPSNRSVRFFARLLLALVVTPILFTTFCRVTIINPVLDSRLEYEEWFQITENQEEEVAVKVERVRQRVEYSVLMGRAPPLSGEAFLETLREEGGKFEEEEREANKQALSNIMSDTLSGGLLGVAVATNRRRVGLLRGWLGERFLSLEASTQAFTLLLIADVLVGYHSSDGWITAINLVFHHYGLPEKEEFTSIFVAIVPVSLDVTFKYWVFKTLRKIAPSTQIILSEIEE